jgi:hypothetical protein
MSTSSARLEAGFLSEAARGPSIRTRLRAYFTADGMRTAQTVLGLIWLLDGGLQFQAFMYTHAFPRMLVGNAIGQPGWLHASIIWGAKIANGDLGVYNTLFALAQVAIGFGLLYRPTVKLALAGTIVWSLFVWWFGEAFGMLLMNSAQPLTGAPGGVILYALIAMVVWPGGRPGGLLGVRGTRIMWAALWLLEAYLWLLQSSSSANAIHDMITAAGSGMGWLTSVQNGFATVAKGNGLLLALVLAALSGAIGLGVGFNRWAKDLLVLSVVLNLVYWFVGQGLGAIFAGGATDPNSGPLFILLAYVVYQLVTYQLVPNQVGTPLRTEVAR